MKPNIFELATKELSQDAFFTWLIQWADLSNKVFDEALNLCAVNFVKTLLSKQIQYNKPIVKVVANRQWNNIDIWAEINDEVFLIIEDKTYTKQHSNQLETYKKIASEYSSEKNLQLVCIYLKTGSESLSSLSNVLLEGFSAIDRREIVELLNEYDAIENAIYIDFKNRLNNIENNTNSYTVLKIKDWEWNSWEGFYTFLQDNIKVRDWSYVSNPKGGFLGLWWHFLDWNGYNVYLQIEQGNLCFKIGEVYENKSAVRNEWHNIIMNKAKQKQLSEIVRPNRFGTGTYMTVALIRREDWLGEDNQLADFDLVIDKLKTYEHFLTGCIV